MMFGYITINRDELKVREAARYDAYYCGLCHSLQERHGRIGQMLLTYDMTFLFLLLSSLDEIALAEADRRCIVHPLKKHHKHWNAASEYAADMNVLLAYYNLLDDWKDDHKLTRLAASKCLKRCCRRVEKRYPRQARAVKDYIQALSVYEKKPDNNIEWAANLTGKMLGEIFVYQDNHEWSVQLREMGFYMGKFIYLMDAYEDVDKDILNGSYNPLISIRNQDDFDERCHQMLVLQMAACCRAFERMPIIEDAEIIRNILYAGVWSKFLMIYNNRK